VVLVGQVRSDLEPTEERRLKQGFVVPGLDYAVESAGGADAADQRGELRLRGPWVAEQYERDERGRDAFVDGWYRTGDVVTLDQHGYVHVVDRMNDLVKSGGEWISTLELEDALSTFPGVTACAVVGVPDERWQERPRAYVVAAQPLDPAAVKAHLAERFPRFWVPDEIVTVESLPLTSVGKYDKRRLRADAGAYLSTP
jgi:fatty-acyl-CoA synthase